MLLVFLVCLVLCDFLLNTLNNTFLNLSLSRIKLIYGENSPIFFIRKNIQSLVMIILFLETLIQYGVGFIYSRLIDNLPYDNLVKIMIGFLFSCSTVLINMILTSLSLINSERVAFICGGIFYPIFIVLKPLGNFMEKISHYVLKFFDNSADIPNNLNYRSEIFSLLQDVKVNRNDEFEEIGMIKHILTLRDIDISRIMTHRSQFIGVNLKHINSKNISDIKKIFFDEKNPSNLIVYNTSKNNLNNEEILGSLDMRILFKEAENNNLENISQFVEPLKLINETTSIFDSLKMFRKNPHSLLFITDEYGYIEGLVTKQDLFEEVFGILDDVNEIEFIDNGVIVDGVYNIRSLNRQLQWDLPDEYICVSGIILSHVKLTLEKNITFNYKNYQFIILEATKNKIKKLFIKKVN